MRISATDYGMAKGALLYQEMLDSGWIEGESPVLIENCRDTVALAEEHEWLDDDSEQGHGRIAFELLVGLIHNEVGCSFDQAIEYAAKFLADRYDV